MIRMINQTGDGYADAYSEGEVESYIAKGWKRYVQAVKVQEAPADPEEVTPVEPTEAPRKRGRPAKA